MERRDFVQLKSPQFSLKLARVSRTAANYDQQKELLGHVAAQLFDKLGLLGTSVGVGGSGSVKAMVDAIQKFPCIGARLATRGA